MKKREKRLDKLKEQTQLEQQFIAWKGNPWTAEQKAEALRLEPNRRIFWRSLLEETSALTDACNRITGRKKGRRS